MEKGQTSRRATRAQSRQKLHLGALRRSSRSTSTASTSQPAVRLRLITVRNSSSIAVPPYFSMMRRISSTSSLDKDCLRAKAARKAGREPWNFFSISSSISDT